jgi:hypothetical protein
LLIDDLKRGASRASARRLRPSRGAPGGGGRTAKSKRVQCGATAGEPAPMAANPRHEASAADPLLGNGGPAVYCREREFEG